MSSNLKNLKIFLKEFLKNKKQIGSIAPSSKVLARKMIQNINFETAKVIVELGPGTGAITFEILNSLNPHTQFICIDSNEVFINNLNKLTVGPNVSFVHACAEDIEVTLQQFGNLKVDAIVSSLPLSLIPKTLKVKLMGSIHRVLKPNGFYVQYQYTPRNYKLIKKSWKRVQISIVMANTPPCIIYNCTT